MVMALNQVGMANRDLRVQQSGLPISATLSGQRLYAPEVGEPVYRSPAEMMGGNPIPQPGLQTAYQPPPGQVTAYQHPGDTPVQQPGVAQTAVAPTALAHTAQAAAAPSGQYGQMGAENATNEYLNAGLGLLNDAGKSALGQFGGAEANTLNLLNQAGIGALNQYGNAEKDALTVLNQSGMAALDKLNTGTNQAIGALNSATAGARGDTALGYLLGGKDIQDAMNNVGSYINQGNSALASGRDAANAAVTSAKNEANSFLNPYNAAGQKSIDLQAAYTGALGPQAQKAAFDAYMSSPNLAWLRQQGEESVMNQAAATGGVGGGDVLKELQKFGTGIAAQDFQNQFDRLSTITNQGINAGTNMGNFSMNAGGKIADNTMSAAQGQAQLAGQGAGAASSLGGQKAAMSFGFGNNMADLTSRYGTTAAQLLSGNGINQAGTISDLGRTGAGIVQNTGAQKGGTITDLAKVGAGVMQNTAGQKADIIANMGNSAFNAVNNAGANVSNMRYNTGTNLANQIGSASNNMANLTNQQGATLSDIIGSGAGNISNLLAGTGTNASQMQMQLAQLLANLATGQGSQLAGLNQQLGAANGAAAAAAGQGLRNTISQGIGAYALLTSDRRLKSDIKKVNERKGINIYVWSWNKLSGMTGVSFGVMADEISKIIPSAVIRLPNGFDCVDYGQVEAYING